MRDRKTFAAISFRAAEKAATRARLSYLAGEMDRSTFFNLRARQEVVAHNRFETLLAREYPGHKPNIIPHLPPQQ